MNTNFSKDWMRSDAQGMEGGFTQALFYILERGWLSASELRMLTHQWRRTRKQVGELACLHRMMTMTQVFDVLGEQAITKELFGAIAVRKGYLTARGLEAVLIIQSDSAQPFDEYLHSVGRLSTNQLNELRSSAAMLDESSQLTQLSA